MTTGERLVSLSGLATGSAMSHLLAIRTGSTAFGSSFTVDIESADIHLSQREDRLCVSDFVPEFSVSVGTEKETSVFTSPERGYLCSRSNELYATEKTSSAVVKKTFETATIKKRAIK